MTPNERIALVKYLEFRLLGVVTTLQEDIDSLLEQRILEEMYDVLVDIEDSIILQEELKIGSSLQNR